MRSHTLAISVVIISAVAALSPAPVTAAHPQAPSASVCTPHRMATALDNAVERYNSRGIVGASVRSGEGIPLWQKNATRPLQPASTTKLLTAAAALQTLPRGSRATTRVVLGVDGSLILRGGGDVTLSRRATGPTFYRNAARLSDLAQQTQRALRLIPFTPRRLIIDNHYYAGPDWAPGWDRWDIGGGSISPIVPTMLDGGRILDNGWYAPHTATPSRQVGATLLSYLGLKDVRIETNSRVLPLVTLASVQSATLEDRVRDMLLHSDNVLAEALGREVAGALGEPRSFQGAASAVLRAVSLRGVSVRGAVLADTSGLSSRNRLTARTLTDTVLAYGRGERSSARSRLFMTSLPVAGQSGTLQYRFTGPHAAARGHIRAKTGSLSGVSTLSGVVYSARSGSPVYFTVLVNRTGWWEGADYADHLAYLIYRTAC